MLEHVKIVNLVRRGALSIATLAALGGAAVGEPAQIVIDDLKAFPESLSSTADGTIIIGSLDHGTVYRAAPGATKATPWIAAEPNGLGRTLGIFVNEAANTVWVCTNDPNPNGNAADLKAFDLKTAKPKGTYPFEGGGLCNDIAVTRDGTTYATDTKNGRIFALKPGTAALTVWAADPKWVGIDGIALLNDGSVLFNNVRQNQLVRVARKSDGTAGAASVLELSQPIDGPDGMRSLPDGRIILAENRAGKIDVVHVNGDKAKVDTIKDGFKLSSTAVTVVGDTAWVIETKFIYRNDPTMKDKDPGPFGPVPVPVPKP